MHAVIKNVSGATASMSALITSTLSKASSQDASRILRAVEDRTSAHVRSAKVGEYAMNKFHDVWESTKQHCTGYACDELSLSIQKLVQYSVFQLHPSQLAKILEYDKANRGKLPSDGEAIQDIPDTIASLLQQGATFFFSC
jgi:hypothetical protein